jgi:hypothetical protein
MTGALPAPSQDSAHHNVGESRPASHTRTRPSFQNNHLDPRATAAAPTIQVTPPSLSQRNIPSSRHSTLTGRQVSRTIAARPVTHLASSSQQHSCRSSGQVITTKPASNINQSTMPHRDSSSNRNGHLALTSHTASRHGSRDRAIVPPAHLPPPP